VSAVEDAGGFRSALTRLRHPGYAGAFDDLSYSTLRGWYEEGSGVGKKKLKPEIEERWKGKVGRVKPDGSGRRSVLSDETEIVDEIRAALGGLRSTSTVINSLVVASVFKAVVGVRKPELLDQMKFSRRWCRDWVRRNMNWTYRKGTTAGQKLPPKWEELVESSIMRAASACATYRIAHPSLVINWDQTALILMPTHNRTYHSRSDKHVKVVALEEKRQITGVSAATMDGELLPMQLIFQGQDHNHKEQKSVPSDRSTTYLTSKHKWKLEQTKNHWSSQWTMQRYVTTIVRPFLVSQIDKHKLPPDSHALLLIDCWSVHKSKEFLDWMKTNYPRYHVVFVPAGCTGVAQPADVILQRPLKHGYKNQYTDWTTQQMMDSLKAGVKPENCSLAKDVKTLKPLAVKWAIDSWLKLKEKKDDIARGWEKIGWSRMLNKDYQIEALTTLNKEDPAIAAAAAAAIEEEPEARQYDEEEEDEDEEVGDNDEDETAEVVLARCVENAGTTSTNRRSSRHSTYRDANLARALQEQTYEELCIFD